MKLNKLRAYKWMITIYYTYCIKFPFFPTDKSPFWPMLQCFVLLLERLGSRIWQMPKFNYMPTDVFRIITENWIYSDSITQWQHGSETPNKDWKDFKRTRTLSSSSSKIYKTAVAWFDPFVKSFLDFDSGGEIVSKVVRYLHDVAGNYCYLLQTPTPKFHPLLPRCVDEKLTTDCEGTKPGGSTP